MRCRIVSKALSDESQTCNSSEEPISDDDPIEEPTRIIRHKKKPKCFSPETFIPKKRPDKKTIVEQISSSSTKMPSPPNTPLAGHSNPTKINHRKSLQSGTFYFILLKILYF